MLVDYVPNLHFTVYQNIKETAGPRSLVNKANFGILAVIQSGHSYVEMVPVEKPVFNVNHLKVVKNLINLISVRMEFVHQPWKNV